MAAVLAAAVRHVGDVDVVITGDDIDINRGSLDMREAAAKKAAETRRELAKTPVDRVQEYAQKAVAEAGLSDSVDIRFRTDREQRGTIVVSDDDAAGTGSPPHVVRVAVVLVPGT